MWRLVPSPAGRPTLAVQGAGLKRATVALAFVVALVSACATARIYTHPWTRGLELGATTEGEIRERFGEPKATQNIRAHDGRSVSILQYSEVQLLPEVAHARAVLYSFHDGRLVGYAYSSSFGADNTDFDDSVADRLVKGQTSEELVLKLLGRPTGRSIYPLVKDPSLRAVIYNYARTDRSGRSLSQHTKTLVVTFDRRGVVVDVSLRMFPVGL